MLQIARNTGNGMRESRCFSKRRYTTLQSFAVVVTTVKNQKQVFLFSPQNFDFTTELNDGMTLTVSH